MSPRLLLKVFVRLGISAAILYFVLRSIDLPSFWERVKGMNPAWILLALAAYVFTQSISVWRWNRLLRAQHIEVESRRLTESIWISLFFNNFLPSNIGGDVVRVTDTAPAAGSKTLAATIVLLDRGLGLLGLALVAALGATAGSRLSSSGPVPPALLWAGFSVAAAMALPALLRPHLFARLLQPLRRLHPEWVDERLSRLTTALARFAESPRALLGCFAGAVVVQAVLIGFYLAIAHSLRIPIGFAELAVIVPISFVVQMIPLSMNGFGIREATFGFYFTRIGLPLESAILVSFLGAALIMVFSLTGAVAYLSRNKGLAQLDAVGF